MIDKDTADRGQGSLLQRRIWWATPAPPFPLQHGLSAAQRPTKGADAGGRQSSGGVQESQVDVVA